MYNVGNVHNQIMCACVSAGVFGVVYVCTCARVGMRGSVVCACVFVCVCL